MTAPIRVLELRSVRGTGGGPEKTIMLSAAASDRRDFHVTVCYIRDARDSIFALDRKAAALGIDYVEVCERHSFDPAVWPALVRLVRDRQIDIVHSHEHKTDLLAYFLGRRQGVVPLATAHGWVGQSWKEKLYYEGDKRLLTRFPRVIAVSDEIRRTLVRYGASPDRITVVLNSIDPASHRKEAGRRAPARAKLGLEEGDIAIGAVGRLERQKRFDILLQAFSELRRRRGDRRVKLFIAGDGSLRNDLSRLAIELGVADDSRLLGHCADVVEFHHALDVFVQSSEYEGTPNAVLEAMALETPAVATDAGGTAEIMRHGEHGLIVPIGDVDALVSAIESTLAAPATSAVRVAAARRRTEQELSFNARLHAVETVYRSLAASRAAVGSEQP
jgi:glycosyltransferase involved in cell wall biosynthesis